MLRRRVGSGQTEENPLKLPNVPGFMMLSPQANDDDPRKETMLCLRCQDLTRAVPPGRGVVRSVYDGTTRKLSKQYSTPFQGIVTALSADW